jgi:hypothetical protein
MKKLILIIIALLILFIADILYREYEYNCGCPDKPGGYDWAHPCYDGGE